MKAQKYVKIAEASEIFRRYFVMNSFDGALAILGVITGAYITGKADARVLVTAGIGLAIATGISGFVGAYLSEKAERTRKIKDIEESIMIDIKGSLIYKASKFVTVFLAIVDGISPALTIFATLVPFLFYEAFPGSISLSFAMLTSVIINLTLLALLGAYLGKISSTSRLKYSILTLSMGIGIIVILYIIGL